MSASGQCPQLDELEAVAAGEAMGETLGAHLEACAECSGRLEEVRANNEMLARLSGTISPFT